MERFFRHFKLPLIVTAVALVAVTIIGIVLVTGIIKSGGANPNERAAQLGQGLAFLTTIVLAPFWVYAVLAAGKERRQELKRSVAKSKSRQTKKKSGR